MDLYNERDQYTKILLRKGVSEETIEDILSNSYMKALTYKGKYDPSNKDAKSFRILLVMGRYKDMMSSKSNAEVLDYDPAKDTRTQDMNISEVDIEKVLSMLDIRKARRDNFRELLNHDDYNHFVKTAEVTGSKVGTVKMDYWIVCKMLQENKWKWL